MIDLGPGSGQDLARLLADLAACLDDADPSIADAFARHYGFEHAIDWIIAMLETHADALARKPGRVTGPSCPSTASTAPTG